MNQTNNNNEISQNNLNMAKNSLENLLPRKRTSTMFPQPKKVKCFQCQKDFYIKFVIPQQDYSKKNS